jgi:hypothetical protein
MFRKGLKGLSKKSNEAKAKEDKKPESKPSKPLFRFSKKPTVVPVIERDDGPIQSPIPKEKIKKKSFFSKPDNKRPDNDQSAKKPKKGLMQRFVGKLNRRESTGSVDDSPAMTIVTEVGESDPIADTEVIDNAPEDNRRPENNESVETVPKKAKKGLMQRLAGKLKTKKRPESVEESVEDSPAVPIVTEVGKIDPIADTEVIDYPAEDTNTGIPIEADQSLDDIPKDLPGAEFVKQPESEIGETALDPIEESPLSVLDDANNPELPESTDTQHTGHQQETELTQPKAVPAVIKKRRPPIKPAVDSDLYPPINEAVVSEKRISPKTSNVVRHRPKMSEAFRLASRDPNPRYGRSRSATAEEAEEFQQGYNRNRQQRFDSCACGCDCECHSPDNNRQMLPVQRLTASYDSNSYYPTMNGNFQFPNDIPDEMNSYELYDARPCRANQSGGSLKIELQPWNDCDHRLH